MENWFTVEAIDSDTYAISEYRHWEETHCYLLCGTESAVLIDTGLGVSDIKEVVDGLTRLPVQVVTTHAHWDHIGGHARFSSIAVGEAERSWLTGAFPIPLERVRQSLLAKPCAFPEQFDIARYRVFQGNPDRLLRDGDRIGLGNRQVTVLHTPGHSPGHCCFYERERKTLYSGDLVYQGCLDAFYPTTDPLQFLHSLEKIERLEIARVFPGHHQLWLPASLPRLVADGFRLLKSEGRLRHGGGVADFGRFQVRL